MNTLTQALALLPWPDWLAVALFFGGWAGYAVWAKRRSVKRPSLLALTNRERARWMLQTTRRDNRVVDGVVVQSLSASPSFFASTTILIIGGLLAVLSATDRASDLVREIPFAARTSLLVFDSRSCCWRRSLSTPSSASPGRCGCTALARCWWLQRLTTNHGKTKRIALTLPTAPAA
jgi:hypothetical protein